MSGSSPDDNIGKSHYIQTVMQARQGVRQAIVEASGVLDPHTSLRPVEETQRRGTRASGHAQMHDLVFDYYDQLAPYGDDLGEMWTEDVATITITKPETVDEADHGGVPAQRAPQQESASFSLDTIDEVRYKFAPIDHQTRNGPDGLVTKTVRYRVLLPLEAVVNVNSQLNACVRELDLGIPENVRERRSDGRFSWEE